MALTDIAEDLQKTYKQLQLDITDNVLKTLVAGVGGQRVKVMSIMISTDTTGEFALRSASEMIFNFHIAGNGGPIHFNAVKDPLFYTNPGQALTIQGDQAAPDANVYIKYIVEA